MHIYELTKFVVRSLRKEYNSLEFNSLIAVNENPYYETRLASRRLAKTSRANTNVKKLSISHRAVKLYNLFKTAGYDLDNTVLLSNNEVVNVLHCLRDNVILGNSELVEVTFTS